MYKYAIITTIFLFILSEVNAQEKILLTEKPGTFELTKHALNTQWLDTYGKACTCSKAESDAMLIKLENLVQIICKTPVMADKKGFDGECMIGGGRCSSKNGYAVPSFIKFWFKSWFLYKEKEHQSLYEPPQWIVEVNQPDKFQSNGFNETDFSNAYNPTNPAFSEKAMSAATAALNELFFQPGVKKVIQPGIDRYGENVILYNPDRPGYWKQVTIREVYNLLINYWKCVPDIRQAEAMVPVLENELSNFTEEEKDGFAWFGNPESTYRVDKIKNDTPVLRANSDYWKRDLPKNSIQFIWLEIVQKDILVSKIENCLKAGDGYYYVNRLQNELDLDKLLKVIEK
jgi:hypothetical protein